MTELSPEVRQSLDAAVHLGFERQQAGDIKSAEALYAQVLLADPLHAVALHNLGRIRLQRGEVRAALDLLGAAVQAGPHVADFHFSLGKAREAAEDAAGSIDAYLQAIALQPGHVSSLINVGPRLHQLGRHQEALALLRRAVQIAPQSIAARHNLGNVLQDLGQLEEAGELYRKIMEHNPLDANEMIQWAVFRLSRRDFSAWRDYAWNHWSPRWLKLDPPVLVPLPKWDGSPLGERSLLLYGEQGIGDEIMFASMLPQLCGQGSRILVMCEPRLVPLFARSFPGISVLSKPRGGQPVVLDRQRACDLRLSLSLLPGVPGIKAAQHSGKPFLLADPAAVAAWRERLAALGGRLTVGLSWRGGHDSFTRSSRSVALAQLAPLFAQSDVRFVNVQYGKHGEEIAAFNAQSPQPLTCFEDIDPLKDMDGLAALLGALDLVISVDNSTVHLAGALGTPTWMLCPFDANWRWSHEREDGWWYESLRLFRRKELGGGEAWAPVIGRIAGELAQLAQRGSEPRPSPRVQGQAAILPTLQPTVLLLNDATYWHDWSKTCSSLAIHERLRAAGHAVDSITSAILDEIVPVPASAADFDDERFFARFQSRERNARILERMKAVEHVVLHGTGDAQDPGRPSPMWQYLAHVAATRLGRKVTTITHDCLPLYIERHRPQTARGGKRLVLTFQQDQAPGYTELLVAIAERARGLKYQVDILSGANAFLTWDDVEAMGALHPRLRGRYRLVAAATEQQWLECIAGADLLVAGRYQHCLAAVCLGTPVMVTADSGGEPPAWLEALGLAPEHVMVRSSNLPHARKRVEALLGNPNPALAPEAAGRLREVARFDLP